MTPTPPPTRELDLDILAQPDDETCGPTCLHAVYRYFGEVPPELRHQAGIEDTPCGLVVIWTTVAW